LSIPQPSSPYVSRVGRDGLQLIVGLFGGAMADCAQECEDWKDCGGGTAVLKLEI